MNDTFEALLSPVEAPIPFCELTRSLKLELFCSYSAPTTVSEVYASEKSWFGTSPAKKTHAMQKFSLVVADKTDLDFYVDFPTAGAPKEKLAPFLDSKDPFGFDAVETRDVERELSDLAVRLEAAERRAATASETISQLQAKLELAVHPGTESDRVETAEAKARSLSRIAKECDQRAKRAAADAEFSRRKAEFHDMLSSEVSSDAACRIGEANKRSDASLDKARKEKARADKLARRVAQLEAQLAAQDALDEDSGSSSSDDDEESAEEQMREVEEQAQQGSAASEDDAASLSANVVVDIVSVSEDDVEEEVLAEGKIEEVVQTPAKRRRRGESRVSGALTFNGAGSYWQ